MSGQLLIFCNECLARVYVEQIRTQIDGATISISHMNLQTQQKKKGRLIVNMPPRHTKSEFASVYFPALDDW